MCALGTDGLSFGFYPFPAPGSRLPTPVPMFELICPVEHRLQKAFQVSRPMRSRDRVSEEAVTAR